MEICNLLLGFVLMLLGVQCTLVLDRCEEDTMRSLFKHCVLISRVKERDGVCNANSSTVMTNGRTSGVSRPKTWDVIINLMDRIRHICLTQTM